MIDLDERGSFLAHVENKNGKAVFNIKAGNELKEDESSIFEDGWMKHKEDIDGLEKYLKQLRIIRQDDWVTMDENELSGSTSISGTPRINRLPRYYSKFYEVPGLGEEANSYRASATGNPTTA